MIDVMITVLPDTDRAMLAKCILSLEHEPVKLYFINGQKDYIGYGRAESLLIGESPYIAYVDPDDEIRPGIFNKIMPMLEDNPVHVYTDEMLIDADGLPLGYGWSVNRELLKVVPEDLIPTMWDDQNQSYFHHLNVFKRDEALPFMPELYRGHRGIEGHLFQYLGKQGTVKHLPEVGYKWRMHESNVSRGF